MAILNNLIVTGNARVQGKIKGDLEGSATTITSVLPIEKGGTGANTTEGAKTNLGITVLASDVAKNAASIEIINTNISNINTGIAGHETRIGTIETEIGELEGRIDDSLGTQLSALKTEHDADILEINKTIATNTTNAEATYATKDALSAEESARSTKDAALDGEIAALKTASASHATSAALEAEASARASGDTALSGQIGSLAETAAATYATKANLNAHVGTSITVGNDNAPGHVKLSNSTSSSDGADKGVAATPAAVKSVRDALTVEENARETTDENLAAHIGNDACHMYTGEETLLNSTIPIDADTVGGWTVDRILQEARGEGTETGTVGFTSTTPTNADSVTLTDVSSSKHLYPRTTTANIIDATTTLMRFAKGTTEPAKEVGVIWFQGSAAPYTIKIWNGSTWEVMNSWQ